MSFEKIDGIYYFDNYRSFFKFMNNWEGDLTVKSYEIFSEGKLIAVFKHKEK